MITTIIIIVIALIMLFILSCALANKIVSKKVYGRRGDASISIKYPLPSDYKNLNVKKDYFVTDLADYGLNVKDYKILTLNSLMKQGIDPNDNNNWANN